MTEQKKKEVLYSTKAPKAVGPYSIGIRSGGFLFLSGQLGLDAETGLIRTLKLTGSRRNDVNELLSVIPPGTRTIYADKGYHSASNRMGLKDLNIEDRIMYRASRGHPLTLEQREFNQEIIPIRSAIERKFGKLKLWHRLGRAVYRGLNRVYRQMVLTALAVNLKRCVALCT